MHLKHLNLATSDVTGLAIFFERFFAFRRLLERGSGALVILRNDEEFVLTLMKLKRYDPAGYPETFHIGFYVDGFAAVEAKRNELVTAGLAPGEIEDAGRSGRGAHFYCTAPGGIVIEVATRPQLQGAA
ncbi:VOC family protein [Bradyrhizobium sp. STM 3557]|uniref:VOC family protein n=1 Tax=Bradyrhizobium sp. STM 3557 TaxID=578920 RepID=UPI0038903246